MRTGGDHQGARRAVCSEELKKAKGPPGPSLCERHVPSPKHVWERCHWPSERITVAKFKTRLRLADTQIHGRMKGERISMQEVRVSKVQSVSCTHKTDVTALAEL